MRATYIMVNGQLVPKPSYNDLFFMRPIEMPKTNLLAINRLAVVLAMMRSYPPPRCILTNTGDGPYLSPYEQKLCDSIVAGFKYLLDNR